MGKVPTLVPFYEYERTCLEETGSVAIDRSFSIPIGKEYSVISKWVTAVVVDCEPESGNAERFIVTLRAVRW